MRSLQPAALALLALSAMAPAASASWPAPTGPGARGLAIDSAGNVWVANYGSDTVTRITSAGTSSGTASGYTCTAVGTNPHSIAIDAADNLYVTAYGPDKVAKVTGKTTDCSAGSVTQSWASTGSNPTEITIDPAGNLFTGNGANTVTRITPAGQSSGTAGDQYAWSATGSNPRGIALDATGRVFTASSDHSTVTRITPAGSPLGTIGTPSGISATYAWSTLAANSSPWGIVLDDAGNAYTANTNTNTVSKINAADGTVAWTRTVGTAPYGIVIDSAGNLYTANNGSNNISKVTADGTATANFAAAGAGPFDIVLDGNGYLYVTNQSANTVSRIAGAQPSPPAIPPAPTAVAGEQAATITAAAPATSARYGSPTALVITAVEDPSRTCTITLPATTCEITGLTAGTPYTFTSAARLGTWDTAPSAASAAVTPTAPAPPAPAPTPTPSPTVAPGPTSSTGGSATGNDPVAPVTRPAAVAISSARAGMAGTIRLRVTVTRGGRITVTGTRGRPGTPACSGARTAPRAGTYAVVCHVTTATRTRLHAGPVAMRLRARLAAAGGRVASAPVTVVAPRSAAAPPPVTG